MSLSRRDFMLGSAGLVVAATRTGNAWPVQASLATGGPRWEPNAELLRHLPRLLELASVPGLGIAVIESGRVWTRPKPIWTRRNENGNAQRRFFPSKRTAKPNTTQPNRVLK